MITAAMYTAARQAAETGLTAAFMQGWGREAREVLAAVNQAIRAGDAAAARTVIAEQMAYAAADPYTARAVFIQNILRNIDDALTTTDERADQEAFEAAMIADMRAFLAGEPVPARFEAPTPAVAPVGALF